MRCGAHPSPTVSTRSSPVRPTRIGPTGTPRTWWRSRSAHRFLHDRGSAKFLARVDAQLREDLAKVPLAGSGAEEQLGCDLRVRATLPNEASDVFFLWSEIGMGGDGALADALACGGQFPAS